MADLCLLETTRELKNQRAEWRGEGGVWWPLPGFPQMTRSARMGLAVIILPAFAITSGFCRGENDALPPF